MEGKSQRLINRAIFNVIKIEDLEKNKIRSYSQFWQKAKINQAN